MFRGCKPLTFTVAAAVAGLAAGTANAEAPLDGALDSTFADNGSATIPFDLLPTGPIDTALDTVVDSFGRVYLVGTVFTASGSRIGIMRLRKDGTPDTTYGLDGNGKVTGPDGTGFDLSGVSAALDADNNLLVGGTRSIGGNYDFAVCKFTLGGTATTFPNGLHCVAVAFDLGGDNKDTLRDIAVQPNGKIVMVGSASTGQGKTAGAVARLDAEGNIDDDAATGFNVSGKMTVLPPGMKAIDFNAVALMANGRIAVVGDSTLNDATDSDLVYARIDSDGLGQSLATSAPFGATRNQTLNELIVLPPPPGPLLLEQSVIAVGAYETGIGSGTYNGLVVQFDGNGEPASSFNGSGYVSDVEGENLVFSDLVREPSGKILVVGTMKPSVSEPTRYYVTRFTPDGERDAEGFGAPAGWSSYSLVTSLNDVGNGIALQDNRIIIAGASLTSANPPNLDFSVIGLARDQIFADGVD